MGGREKEIGRERGVRGKRKREREPLKNVYAARSELVHASV